MPSDSSVARAPTPQQIEATNDAISGLNFIQKGLLTNLLKQLPDLLQADELPERMLGVTRGANDDHLLVATNLRIMLVHKPMLSFSGQLKVQDAPWEQVTSIEWRPGMLRHHIIVRMGRKKWDCEIPGIHGKGHAVEMTEHVEAKITAKPDSPRGSLPQDPKNAKLQAIERMVHHLSLPGSEWKQLPNILDRDEMPERLLHGEYDNRNGLKVASGENHIGLLVATDHRLLFVSKPPLGRRKVYEFAYNGIEQVEYAKGLMMGALTVHAHGRAEIFRAPNSVVEGFAKYIQERTGTGA